MENLFGHSRIQKLTNTLLAQKFLLMLLLHSWEMPSRATIKVLKEQISRLWDTRWMKMATTVLALTSRLRLTIMKSLLQDWSRMSHALLASWLRLNLKLPLLLSFQEKMEQQNHLLHWVENSKLSARTNRDKCLFLKRFLTTTVLTGLLTKWWSHAMDSSIKLKVLNAK